MKNLLSEELKRYRILFNYNTKLTLTENTEIISKNSILNEQAGTSIKAAEKALKGLGTTIGKFTKMEVSALTRILAMDEKAFAAELQKAMKVDIKAGQKVMVTANELSKIQVIREITSQKPQTVAEMNQIIKDVKNQNTIKFQDLQLKTPIKPTTGGKGKTTTTGGKKPPVKNTKPAKQKRIKKPDPIPNKPTNWELFKTRIKGWKTTGKILAGLFLLGGIYLAYKWWSESKEVSSMFPDCIRKNIPEEDFKKMVEQGLDYVLITDTGNDTIDQYGGGKFFDDKKFVTGNGKYTGTWDDTDSGIVITVGGTDYAMSCEGVENPEDSGTDGSDTDDNTVIPTTTTTTTIWEPNRTEVGSDEYEK